MASTSTAKWGIAWAPSIRTIAPCAFACAVSSATGLIVPSAFDAWVSATIRVFAVSSRSNAFESSSPRAVIGTGTSLAPVLAATSCQGTMFE